MNHHSSEKFDHGKKICHRKQKKIGRKQNYSHKANYYVWNKIYDTKYKQRTAENMFFCMKNNY